MVKSILVIISCFAGLSLFGQVNWEVDVKEDNSGAVTIYQYYLKEVSFQNNKTNWAIDAPDVYSKKPFYSGRDRIDINTSDQPPAFLLDHPFTNSSIVVLPFTSGLMVLNAQNGEQIYRQDNELQGNTIQPAVGDSYWFDDGKYTINCNKEAYQSDLVYSANFLRKYKNYVLHFNGKNLFILSAKNGKLQGENCY